MMRAALSSPCCVNVSMQSDGAIFAFANLLCNSFNGSRYADETFPDMYSYLARNCFSTPRYAGSLLICARSKFSTSSLPPYFAIVHVLSIRRFIYCIVSLFFSVLLIIRCVRAVLVVDCTDFHESFVQR
ncbi:unnamed protein product [Clavelina lepadiformis]|uniref:Uncharacterized protein n=1 Tax=Clavelina lepadiformis TaxID=159417 RepID=A0ABP0GQ27_CLALP